MVEALIGRVPAERACSWKFHLCPPFFALRRFGYVSVIHAVGNPHIFTPSQSLWPFTVRQI